MISRFGGKNVQIGLEFFKTMDDVELNVSFNLRIEWEFILKTQNQDTDNV
jgi:hypothetical protein